MKYAIDTRSLSNSPINLVRRCLDRELPRPWRRRALDVHDVSGELLEAHDVVPPFAGVLETIPHRVADAQVPDVQVPGGVRVRRSWQLSKFISLLHLLSNEVTSGVTAPRSSS